jgi:hypothetical protein
MQKNRIRIELWFMTNLMKSNKLKATEKEPQN